MLNSLNFFKGKIRVNKRFFNIFVLKTIFERVNATKWSDIIFHFIHATIVFFSSKLINLGEILLLLDVDTANNKLQRSIF